MATGHFLIKSEPTAYSFEQLVADGKTQWTGVRNFAARNTLRAMKKGDGVLFYHSNDGKAVVGVARVARTAFPDPTANGEDWSAVDLEPVAQQVRELGVRDFSRCVSPIGKDWNDYVRQREHAYILSLARRREPSREL